MGNGTECQLAVSLETLRTNARGTWMNEAGFCRPFMPLCYFKCFMESVSELPCLPHQWGFERERGLMDRHCAGAASPSGSGRVCVIAGTLWRCQSQAAHFDAPCCRISNPVRLMK